jgi:hypothetical protein
MKERMEGNTEIPEAPSVIEPKISRRDFLNNNR